MLHVPVLLQEVLMVLDPQPDTFFVDGTLGAGGHALAILKKISPGGVFLGIDRDKEAIIGFKERIAGISKSEFLISKLILVNDSYKNIPQILERKELGKVDRILLDLGFSSDQMFGGIGFSFRNEEPLIMRYDRDVSKLTAARVVNEYDQKRLAEIIKKYGEERFAERIASGIVHDRKKKRITTTRELAESIERSTPKHKKIHPATKTFMALRIFINQELEQLEEFLGDIPNILSTGGRLAIISFHSLEDRIVKHSFRELEHRGVVEILTKKPLKPTKDEIANNPRSRSAKLRAIEIR